GRGAGVPGRHRAVRLVRNAVVARHAGRRARAGPVPVPARRRAHAADRTLRDRDPGGGHRPGAHLRPAAAVRLVRRLGAAREPRGRRDALPREHRERVARGAGAPALGAGGGVKVLIAGGGTGGHVYPGIAVAEHLTRTRRGSEVVFVGGTRGLEAQVVPAAGFRLRTILTRGLPRRAWWRWPAALASNLVGFVQAIQVVAAEKPDVVLGTGGYVSGPVALAA